MVMRTHTLTLTIAATLASLALGACGRDAESTAAGGYVTPAQQASVVAAPSAPVVAPVPADPVPVVEYADVTNVRAVSESHPAYATVVASEPVTRDTSTSQQVCHDVVVEERVPERDGLAGGTIAGAVVGGALGNQAGSGDGKKLATLAGAIAGGLAGREIDRRHEGGNVVARTEQQCETAAVPSTEVIGYDVRWRTTGGDTGTKRLTSSQAVGSRIQVGSQKNVIGYDVTYRFDGKSQTIRLDRRPGDRLAIVDGEVVTSSVALNR
jgi:uncharacterized protein YcfJ